MEQVTALHKHPCPACGAQAEWSPTKHALVCPYCGTEAPAELEVETGQIHELDLAATLRDLPDEQRGWLAEKRTVQCRSCRATSVFDPERVGQRCPFCGSPELVDYEEIKAPLRPESLLPFKVDQGRVRESIRGWYAGKWLAPGDLKRRALVDTVRGVYLPYWTFDAQVHCRWTAEAGYYYYETEMVRRGDRVEKRQVRKTRWKPAAGELDHFFDDQPIAGSHGVDRQLLRQVEPFPTTTDLVPYDTSYVSGFVIEHYQVVLFDAARQARAAMEQKLRQLCAAAVPGDTQRNLQIKPTYSGETFKLVLVPAWLLSYDYHGKAFQVLVNGYTGHIAGKYPLSGWKIFFLVLLALFVVAILLFYGR